MVKQWVDQGFTGKDNGETRVKALRLNLKMRLLHLDESQNFADEVFTSIVNQGSDLVTAFTIMQRPGTIGCFYASMIVLGVNCVVRLVVGLITACSNDVETKSTTRVLLGLVVGMIEPVSGNALLDSGVSVSLPVSGC
jgi:hypothetical protein